MVNILRGDWLWMKDSGVYNLLAGWTYRLIMESLLGLRVENSKLHIDACMPEHWSGFTIHYRYRETVYQLGYHGSPLGESASLSARWKRYLAEPWITLVDDSKNISFEVRTK